MKKTFTFIALLCAAVLTSCEKSDDVQNSRTETIEIEVESGGGEYTFSGSTIEVVSAPDEYYAEVENNTIVGNYAGSTTATIVSDNTTYNCNITVSPSYTYYIDMAIYMGQTKSVIEALYGDPTYSSGSTYLYSPLSEYLNESYVAFIYEDNKVKTAASYFTSSQSYYILKHLTARYVYVGISNSIAYYCNAINMDDCTMGVAYDYSNSSYTFVMYFEYTSSSATALSSTKSITNSEIDTYKTALEEIMNLQ